MRIMSCLCAVLASVLGGCMAGGFAALPGQPAYIRLSYHWTGADADRAEAGVPRDVTLAQMKVFLRRDDRTSEHEVAMPVIGEGLIVITEVDAAEAKDLRPGAGIAGRAGWIKVPENLGQGWYDVVVRYKDKEGKAHEVQCDSIFVARCEGGDMQEAMKRRAPATQPAGPR